MGRAAFHRLAGVLAFGIASRALAWDACNAKFSLQRDTKGTASLFVEASGEKLHFPLKVVKQGTPLYHWTSGSTLVERARKKQGLCVAELKGGCLVASGPGTYVSLNPIDSSTYGDHLVVFSTSRDLLVAKQTTGRDPVMMIFSTKKDSRQFVCLNRALSRIGVDGIEDSPSSDLGLEPPWMVLVRGKGVASSHLGTGEDILAGTTHLYSFSAGNKELQTRDNIARLFDRGLLKTSPRLKKLDPGVDQLVARRPLSNGERARFREWLKGLRENPWALQALRDENSAAAPTHAHSQ